MHRRRFLLSGALAAFLQGVGIGRSRGASLPGQSSAASAESAPRLVVLDWGLTETLLALDVVPVGVAEIPGYHDHVVDPAVPVDVQDVGLRLAPSLELLEQLAPDLILINSSQESQRAMLERIAPVRAFAIYTDAGMPYRRAQDVTLQLGQLCGRENAARTLIEQADHVLAENRTRLAALRALAHGPARPLYLIQFFDVRHVGIYGARSLFEDVMNALDTTNAWHGPTDYWGIGVAGLEKLAASPDANVLVFQPLPAGVERTLASNRLWHALPAISAGRVDTLPPFWGFGMLPSAARFARELAHGLTRLAEHA